MLILILIINYKKRILAEQKYNIIKEEYDGYKKHYKKITERNKKLKYIRHDLVKQIAVTNELMDKDDIVNVIILQKKEISENNGIIFDAEVYSPGIDFSEPDIISLISNLLDNAIEACMRVNKELTPKIKMTIKEKYICVINDKLSTESIEPEILKTSKKDKANHGYGIQIIKEVVKKYKGTINFCDYGDKLETKIRFL